MLDFELACTELISNAGEARALCIEAIDMAMEGNFEQAEQNIQNASEYFDNCHNIHFKMLQENFECDNSMKLLLLIHTEDQMSSAETFKIMANKMLKAFQKLNK